MDTLIPRGRRAVSVGGAPGPGDARRRDRGDRGRALHARLHQRALAGGDLVPGPARGAPGVGRASSGCTTARSTPTCARWVEQGLKEGRLKAVVATSSLDLGVDFSPVDRVLQIGSPKGVARLLQRAGRSGHAPGQVSRVTCVPSHALEFVEAAAARRAALAGRIEARTPGRSPARPAHAAPRHHRGRARASRRKR